MFSKGEKVVMAGERYAVVVGPDADDYYILERDGRYLFAPARMVKPAPAEPVKLPRVKVRIWRSEGTGGWRAGAWASDEKEFDGIADDGRHSFTIDLNTSLPPLREEEAGPSLDELCNAGYEFQAERGDHAWTHNLMDEWRYATTFAEAIAQARQHFNQHQTHKGER